jgi:Lar family restriction alleviation protein
MTSPSKQDAKLLPCPFCGRDAANLAVGSGCEYVVCGCGAEGPARPSEAEAIAVWNRRFPTPPVEGA